MQFKVEGRPNLSQVGSIRRKITIISDGHVGTLARHITTCRVV